MASESIDHFIKFCTDANIDPSHHRDSVRKYVLAYQRNLERKNAFKVMFGDVFINWEYTDRGLPRMDAAHWINVLKYFDFSSVEVQPKSILCSIQHRLKTLGLNADPNFACRVFLLTNMNFIASQLGLERLFCEYEIPDAYNKSLRFFALGADTAFDVLLTTGMFCLIMDECKVDEAEVEKQIQFLKLREEELSNSFKVKQIRAMNGRPRLRSKLADVKRDINSVEVCVIFLLRICIFLTFCTGHGRLRQVGPGGEVSERLFHAHQAPSLFSDGADACAGADQSCSSDYHGLVCV